MRDLNDKVTGSTLTATEWNEVPSELQNVIEALGITLSAGDLNQLGKAVAGYVANGQFYTDSGIADAYVLSVVGSKQRAPNYTDGFTVSFTTTNPNTGAATVNVASLGVKNIKLDGGIDPQAGDISDFVELRFDLANDYFILKSPASQQNKIHLTTADMVADLSLKEGQHVKTLEHTTGNGYDGGNLYLIGSALGTADDQGYIFDLDNGLQAQGLFPDGIIKGKQFDETSISSLQTAVSATDLVPRESRQSFGGFNVINGLTDPDGVFEFANFAGQSDYGNEPIGFIFHHYTNGELVRLDNVGEGPAIRILNASNPGRRIDQGPAYIGTGNFLEFAETGTTDKDFFINNDLVFQWVFQPVDFNTGNDPGTSGKFSYTFAAAGAQTLHTEFKGSGSRFLSISEASGGGGANIVTDRSSMFIGGGATSTLTLRSGGSVVINTGTDSFIQGNGSGDMKLDPGSSADSSIDCGGPLKLQQYANIASAPSLPANSRALAWADDINQLIAWDGTAWAAV